ncbi:MAG: tetratricopeptide repeat protein [Candidatus Marinimicrobia bacterium]|nr:tetratricopeptide repeat protein [Euryarchaeota archaeon]MCG2715011.1 tetratricopeptide repeat protein [Candidatus Neomarinimicrobiota bacterium]MCG2737483.1 tetratricopeptide repeat protein [Candidatus Methanoperedenaceae archaeon]
MNESEKKIGGKTAFEWFELGLEEKNLTEKIEDCSKALEIEINPKDDAAWYNWGIFLDRLKRYEEAIKSYDKSLEINPRHESAWFNRGNSLDRLKRYEEAIKSYDKLLEINPRHHAAWLNRGNSLDSLKRYEDAIKSYDKSLEINPKDEAAWLNRGNSLDNLKRYEDAIKSYDKSLEINPNYDAAWLNMGISLDNLKRYEEAIKSYDKSLEINPKDEAAWFFMGNSLRDLKRYEEAIKSYDKVLEINSGNEDVWNVWNNKGEVLFYLERYEEAINSYDKALEIDYRNKEIIANKEKAKNKFNEIQKESLWILRKAEEITDKANYAGISNDESLLLKARESINRKKYSDAIKFSSDFIERLESEIKEKHKEAQEGITQAQEELEKARSFYIASDEPLLQNAITAFENGNYKQAIQDSEIYIHKTESFINDNRPSLALEFLMSALKYNTGRRTHLVLKNDGELEAKNIELELSGDIKVRIYSKITRLKPKEIQKIDVWLKPTAEGEFPVDISLKYEDPIDRSYEEQQELWISTENKLDQQEMNETPSLISTSDILIDRTIYDPIKQDFITSLQRPLPNVKKWIEKTDSSMYWLVLCINNNSDISIEEWGIELETPTTVKILDARIEGQERVITMSESNSKPWITHSILGIPQHLGIIIPKKASKRVYFKIGSEACGVSLSIKGKVTTSDCDIPIKTKRFRYSCDAVTFKGAIRTNPEDAEKYVHSVLMSAYSGDTAHKLLHTFKIVQDIDRCCIPNEYGEIKFNEKGYNEIQDKLKILLGALEGAKVGDNLIKMVKADLGTIRFTKDAFDSAYRIKKLCGNILDEWTNDILKNSNIGGFK